MSLKSPTDRESFFNNFVFKPEGFSLFSWLLGDILVSVSLFPEEDIELTIFWISGNTFSDMAVLIALFIWLCTMAIMESISWDSLRLNSFEKVSKDCLTSFCLYSLLSWEKFLYSSLWYRLVSLSLRTEDCSITSVNSLSIGFSLPLPNITSKLSISDIMSISLDFLVFAFWRLVEGMRDCCKRKEFKLKSLSLQMKIVFGIITANLTVTIRVKIMTPGPRVPVIYNQLNMTSIKVVVISLILATGILKIDTTYNVSLQIYYRNAKNSNSYDVISLRASTYMK